MPSRAREQQLLADAQRGPPVSQITERERLLDIICTTEYTRIRYGARG